MTLTVRLESETDFYACKGEAFHPLALGELPTEVSAPFFSFHQSDGVGGVGAPLAVQSRSGVSPRAANFSQSRDSVRVS